MKSAEQPGSEQYVALGKIGGPWGLKGEVKFQLYHAESKVLYEARHVYLKAGFSFQKIPLISARPQGKMLRIHLEGFTSPEETQPLSGQELFVPREDLPPPAQKEHFAFELVGMTVVTGEGVSLGKVRNVVHYGASEILVVRDEEGKKETMIPLIPDFLREISPEEKIIVVTGVEDLI